MKLSVVFLFGIVLALSGMSEALSCVEKIDLAQKCAYNCGYEPSTNATFSNLLQQCVIETKYPLSSCCYPSAASPCKSEWEAAEACLAAELGGVQQTAKDYFDCVLTPGNCELFRQQFCVNAFAGGYDVEGSPNNFAVREASILANNTENATSCDDKILNKFGYDFCNTFTTCCTSCDEQVGKLANAILDDLLIPAYGQLDRLFPNGTLSPKCSKNANGNDKTCANDYLTSQSRFLETERASLAGPKTLSPENAAIAADLAFECNEGLSNDMIVHNETYAISNYLDCVYKKTGKAAAKQEDLKQAESSSSSLPFGPTAALSAIASSLYAIFVA